MDDPDGATPIDPSELEGLRFRHVTTREELDQLEQVNVQKGMAWLKRQKDPDMLTEAFVCKLHRQLFGEVWKWAGQFRETEKNIGVDVSQIAMQLRLLLDDTRYWIEHDTWPPIELAVRFHHKLVFIHPFANGNGRFSRIMADAILTKRLKQPPIDWAGGHGPASMGPRRDAYIAALRAADKGDMSRLLRFVGVEPD